MGSYVWMATGIPAREKKNRIVGLLGPALLEVLLSSAAPFQGLNPHPRYEAYLKIAEKH